MQCTAKFVRISKYLLAGVTVFCVSWIACVNEWHSGVRWRSRRAEQGLPTMRTIVAYSEGAQAALDKPMPITCSRLPAYPEIPFLNRTWGPDSEPATWQHVKDSSVSLYAAYYDERTPQHYIRILGIFHGNNFSTEDPVFCQTRSSNSDDAAVEVVAAKPLEIWWHDWDKMSFEVDTPLLLSCPLTEPLNTQSVVSVVKQPCDDPTNGFNLVPSLDKKYKRTFTICVKDMIFNNDIAYDLMEWIETNKLLGVEMIDMYIDSLSQKNINILIHYEIEGFVRLFKVPIKNNPNRSLWQRRRDHILSYNDCLYRNIRESKYIVPLDIDEILLPKKAYTWFGLLKRLARLGWNPSQYSAILVQNVFFFEFMQDIQKDKFKKSETSVKKPYDKRDDVRINYNEMPKFIELIYLNNSQLNNKHIHSAVNDNYKSECGDKLPVSKLASHVISSAIVSPVGQYSKSIMLTKKVLTAFNHYPLSNLGTNTFSYWPAHLNEVQINHYKETCNTTLVEECARYERRVRIDRSAAHLRHRLTRALARKLCPTIKNT